MKTIMDQENKQHDSTSSYRRLMGRYYYICGGFLFLFGFVLMLLGEHCTGYFGKIIVEIGTFLALVVAIHFIYEILIKKEERRLFSMELEMALNRNNKVQIIELLNQMKPVGVRYLEGETEIYGSAARLCRFTQKRIRAVVTSTGPKASAEFVNAVIARLQQGKGSVQFEAVLVLNPEQVSTSDVKKNNEKQFMIFEEHGVKKYLHLYILDSKLPINFDLLIVDNQSAHIGITTYRDTHKLSSAIEFENQPDIARDLDWWFEYFILKNSIRYEDWIRQRLPNEHPC